MCSLVIFAPSGSANQGMGEFQECDQRKMMEPITKWRKEFHMLKEYPGLWNVFNCNEWSIGSRLSEMPINIGGKITSGIIVDGPMRSIDNLQDKGIRDPELISQAVELILLAKHPVVIVNGAGSSAQDSLENL